MHSSFSGYLLVLLDVEFLITAKIVKHNPKVYLIWINATRVTDHFLHSCDQCV